MKKLVGILSIFLIAIAANAQDTVNVTVTLENVLNDKGTLLVSLHTNETFMKGSGVMNLKEAATAGSVTFTFENVAPGSYAVMALHDENDNQRMDFEPNGMPKENYGMSGNEMTMGPPSFADAQFEVGKEDVDLVIRF
ncbi:Hypothetical protein I595_3656 [Croceitalea dokdonensis DOKDO 023]|uniref:DUF2141 domain-containing protein n=1 Tax=Croceitalea dokdonensis DOKDO 023 TaxID=1300341 RepID=A0A0P7ARA4_9FLAO|nr:DUF2141 domain-containing protein [Croceitalea dokdonensis]KPM30246.1 Hypothetical protein I595_3656 [Croceitalea dokdonensis DOKDO 023]